METNSSISKLLLERLVLEYRYSSVCTPESLLESDGIPDIVNKISVAFGKCFKEWMLRKLTDGVWCSDFVIGKDDIVKYLDEEKDIFFNSLNVSICITLDNDFGGELGYVIRRKNYFSDKLAECRITGNYKMDIARFEMSLSNLVASFAHELLHAFEDFKRNASSTEHMIDNVKKYRKDFSSILSNDCVDKKRIKQIVYFLTPQEIRAYCVQIIKQTEDKLKDCVTSKEAFDIIKNTDVWQNYENIEDYVHDIANRNIDCSETDIIAWWKELTGKDMTYNNIVRNILMRLRKAKAQIINNIGKRIAEISSENDNWMFIK